VLSLRELLQLVDDLTGRQTPLRFDLMRTGDQLYYVSDTSRFHIATGWYPRVDARTGVAFLYDWLLRHRIKAELAGASSSEWSSGAAS
jgi:CDP-paratose 2-epimerase